MENIFIELGLVLVVATIVSGIMFLLKQPLIIGHIVTGLVAGPYFLNILKSQKEIEIFSQLGIALLIFIIGLSLSPKIIKEVGKVSLITGIGKVLLTSGLGFLIGKAIGFSNVVSLYIALALTFSSTIIILKLLSDKKDLGRLYGKITTGFLLTQDIIAMLIIIGIAALANTNDTIPVLALKTITKGAVLVAPLLLISKYLLPKIIPYFAKSTELLFVFSLSWGLGIAILFKGFGFSIEIGALFAGIALAGSPYSFEISSKLKPLRDFFIILWFVILGTHITLGSFSTMLVPVVIFSLFVLIASPLIIMTIMGLLGHNKKNSFKAGVTVAQISEFSHLLVILGLQNKHLALDHVALITMVGLVTMGVSTYYITYSDQIFKFLSPILGIFERKSIRNSRRKSSENYEIILFGFDHVGHEFIDSFEKMGKKFLVVDFNPEVVNDLSERGVNCHYGDADDNEFLDNLNFEQAKMVISTITDFETTSLIVRHARANSRDAIIIVKSERIDEATELYKDGASYVMMPHYLGTNHTCTLISKHGFDLSAFTKERDRHIAYLLKKVEANQWGTDGTV